MISKVQVRNFAFICLIWLMGFPALAEMRVIDGDTLERDGVRYRINGIDAPEFGQTCNGLRGTWPCGAEALKRLVSLIQNAEVECTALSTDPYDRIIATCSAGGRDLGAAMVEDGLAWAFIKFSDIYVAQQDHAKANKLGIWSANNQPAWTYRAERWNSAETASPNGCPIKGNISRNGRIYHPPWSPWYQRTRINLAKGERWFCDEAEAIAAGWRAPRWP